MKKPYNLSKRGIYLINKYEKLKQREVSPMDNTNKLTKRAINAQETKNTIFNSALILFSKYGYDNVTIEQITKHAGVSKGNYYTHFKSKEYVFVELFHRIDNHYIEAFEKVDVNETAENKLRLLFKAMCEYCFYVCGIDAIKIVYANQISTVKHTKILNNDSRPFYEFLRIITEQGQKNNEFRNDLSIEDMVNYIARSARALLYDWCLYNNEFNLVTECDKYIDFILGSLKKI